MAVMKLEAQEENFVRGLKSASGAVGELTGMINVQLARSFKGADFYSRNFEKGIGRLATSFKEAGQGMTIGLTLPLAFLAKSASDAYAELDSLKKGLGTLETTTEGLNGRLRELREIAKAPGIGFQEAIQGDLRLRSVGISAATSAKILKEFANAVALTGGGKEQLNEITVQLGQMAAKGKVLAQDLRPIIEAAPAVSQALKNMFGTVSSEAISEQLEKTGKSSTDMINMLLTELAKAPRVTGGWKNALENLGTSLFVAKAEMFEVADKLFDLQGILASVTSAVEGFVEGFKNLPEPMQKLIIGLTTLVALLGPLSYGVGLLINAIAAASTAIGVATLGVGALVVAISALALGVFSSIAEFEKFNKTTQELTKTKQEAVRETDKEVKHLQNLLSVVQDSSSSTKELKMAKDELIKINPEYASILKSEKIDYGKLNDATSKYVTNLIKIGEKKKLIAQQDAAIDALGELRAGGGISAEERFTAFLSSDISEIWEKRIKKAGGLLDYETQLVYNKAYKLSSTLQDIAVELKQNYADISVVGEPKSGGGNKGISGEDKKAKAISDAEKFVSDFLKIQEDSENRISKGLKEAAENRVSLIDSINATLQEKRYDGLRGLLSYYASLEGIETLNQQEKDENKVYKELGLSTPDQIKKAWDKRIQAMMEGQADEIAKRKKATDDAEKMSKEKIARIQEDINNFSVDMMAGIAESIIGGDPFSGILKQSLSALGNFAIQLGKQYFTIAKLKDMIFKNGITQNNALALIAGGVLVKGLASRITVPKLAQGGMATNPTLAMIGDNKSGKEMVLPFERTGEFADMIGKKMGGGGNFTSTARISGNDLLILTERAKRAK